jgi:hydroxymethylpyrimidine/phosphomethylpyrimidine kinase
MQTVLVFAGHDPSGGAGIQADIEAIGYCGCHATTIITAHTVQNTHGVRRFVPADALLIEEQARVVLDDIPIQAIKIGMVGTTAALEAIHSVLIDYPMVPVIFDPVLAGGAGAALSDDDVTDAILHRLLPRVFLVTPNSIEARQLAQHEELADCARTLLATGCQHVLIKGSHEATADVIHTLYSATAQPLSFRSERLPQVYHGSGCTFTASIAAFIAQGIELRAAITQAQSYTLATLRQAYRLSNGQWLPRRSLLTDD